MADDLSRAPLAFPVPSDQTEGACTEMLVQVIISSLPAQEGTLESTATEQSKDSTLSRVKSYCRSGWPARDQLDNHVLSYWPVSDSLTLAGNLLLYNRYVVPPALWRSILKKIHGPQVCRSPASVQNAQSGGHTLGSSWTTSSKPVSNVQSPPCLPEVQASHQQPAPSPKQWVSRTNSEDC